MFKELTDEQVMNLLCAALEGGSNYWISEVHQGEEPAQPLDNDFAWFEWWPVYGGSIKLVELDPDTGERKQHILNKDVLREGLAKMAEKSPRHFADVLAGNDDGETGDVFLQYCLLGELIYG